MEKRKKVIERVSVEEKKNLLENYLPFLSKGKFVNVATCNLERMPNVAPKPIAKTKDNIIYLVDYVIGSTYANLKENPRVSISFVDDKTLTGYQLNGTVSIIDKGPEFEALSEEFQQIKTDFTVERILFNLRTGKKTMATELSLPEKFIILKIKVIEIVEISSSGGLKSKVAF
jgi:predicted pyridoxine 5'-phosphate oxidase superfamily flavin-nucleotide-binding protein